MTTVPEALPKDAVLLHIGPHKTGTTAIQTAMNAVRDELSHRNVHYLGAARYREQAPLGILNRSGRTGIRKPTRDDWDKLLAEVRSHPDRRVVLSSERYCWASKEQASQILADLGRDRVHVVITLRPLDRILPSQWQMSVQGGLTSSYEQWLESVFSDSTPPPAEARTFWKRHAHGELVRRWQAVAGADNVTVIVVDGKDHSMLPRTFAALLDLPSDLLVPIAAKSNRSLTAGEVELVRQVNEAFVANQWSAAEHARLVRGGLSRRLRGRQPGRDEPKITTPTWAVELAANRADSAIAAIRSSGVRVAGDLEWLRIGSSDGDTTTPEDAQVPAAAGALAVLGVLEVDRETRRPSAGPPASRPPKGRPVSHPFELEAVGGRELLLALQRRVRRRFSRSRDVE